ncbi:MAG: hypothetical protein KGL39_16820 [Patescibacteria group bacterium]|nr:hypothetical protein [Patescibacteria group bacterium]
MTKAEREHVQKIKELPCIVCGEPGPSDAHEPEQGLWFISVPLCKACHTGPDGWHGTRLRWKLRKMDELKAINATYYRLST